MQKVKALQKVIDMNLTKDTFSRICCFIAENEEHLEKYSSKEIAEILHTKPETLSRNFAILKQKKIITIEKRKIKLLDKKKLLELY